MSTGLVSLPLSRLRMPLLVGGAWALVLAAALDVVPGSLYLALFAAMCAVWLTLWSTSPPPSAAVDIAAPVDGRWEAYNSPSSGVPSHGVHGWAQTYALDLVFDPPGVDRPAFGESREFRAPSDYPGFGAAIRSPIDGEVVIAHDRWRDHRDRNSHLGRLLMLLEGFRELGGPLPLLGNHVVLRHEAGWYVLLAHLRRGSVRVRPGERVRLGDELAACGNSGNSSEPHLHLQVMDRASVWTAIGRPFTIDGEPPPESGLRLEAGSTSAG